MAPSATVKRSYQSYKTTCLKLETQLEQLRRKREDLESRVFVVLEESDDVTMPRGKHLVEEQEVYRSEVSSLVSTATDVLLEILEMKLSFVQEALHKLSTLVKDNPKSLVPPELGFSRYEEWLETNQRLFELNSQLYDLEKLKFEIQHKKRQARTSIAKGGAREGEGLAGSLFVQSSIQRIQGFLTRFRFPTDAASTSQTYIQDLLSPREDRMTLEAQKVQEYVTECTQHGTLAVDPAASPRGAHPQRYQEFMGVLCGYIVEKQREWQGEELPYDLVYNTVEQYLMPKIKPSVLQHAAQTERDDIISRQCQAFSNVTLEQLRVKPQLRSKELVPFIDSISSLRASYFSPNPTDKMYTIVAAAKALYDQLGVMGELSIDGDSFLDLWVYVILKANVKDLATNLCFMVEYGNPQLANDEAGYYLTTLEAAVAFIEGLTAEQLNQPKIQEDFVVCERERFSELACLPASCFRVVREGVELQGYQVAIIQEWALNRARLFSSVLVSTGDPQDTAIVDVIRLSPDSSSAAHIQYFTQPLLNPTQDLECLQCQNTPLGVAVVVDTAKCDPLNLIILPSGDFDKHSGKVERVLQLIRLGSQGRGESCDVCIIPSTPSEETSFLTAPEMRSGFSNGVPIPLRQSLMPDDRSLKSKSATESAPYLLHSHLRQSYSESVGSRRSWRQSNISVTDGIRMDGLQSQALGVSAPNNAFEGSGDSELLTRKTVTVQAEVYDPTSSGVSSSRYFSISERHTDVPTASLPIAVPDITVSLKSPIQDKPESTSFNCPSSLPPSFTPVTPPRSLVDIFGPKQKTRGQEQEECRLSQAYFFDGNFCSINAHLVNPHNILSSEYGKELEGNFVENHLFGDSSQALDKGMAEIVTQGQLYLQRLNYLSITQTLDGVYNDATLYAVKRFQIAHNSHESMYSTVLPENGYLTVPTFQYLRQAFLTIFASLLRLGLDRDLGNGFNPVSTSDADVRKFRECVELFQKEHKMAVCQRGTLCANTIDKIRHVLRTQRHTIS